MGWLFSAECMIDGIGQVEVPFLQDWDINHTMQPPPQVLLDHKSMCHVTHTSPCLMLPYEKLRLLWEATIVIIVKMCVCVRNSETDDPV